MSTSSGKQRVWQGGTQQARANDWEVEVVLGVILMKRSLRGFAVRLHSALVRATAVACYTYTCAVPLAYQACRARCGTGVHMGVQLGSTVHNYISTNRAC